MTALFRPEITDLLLMHAANALMRVTWNFDILFSFAVSFGILYGLFSLVEKVLPRRPGGRPWIWKAPCLFAITLIGFPFFLDPFVSGVIFAALGRFPWWPEMWFVQSAACVWLAGCLATLLRDFRDFARLAKMVGALPDCPENPMAAAAIAAVGVGGTVRVKNGPLGAPIFSCGLLRKFIIVPEDFPLRYSAAEQFAILLHECVHLRNRDPLKLFCLNLAKAILWFDPAARHALHGMKTGLELLCDWTVVNTHRVDRAAYAALIVRTLSERRQAVPGFSATFRLASLRLSQTLGDDSLKAPDRISRRTAFFLLAGLAALLAAAAATYAGLDPIPPTDMEGLAAQGYEVVHHAERSGVFSRYIYHTVTR